jgi:hypothetical protein
MDFRIQQNDAKAFASKSACGVGMGVLSFCPGRTFPLRETMADFEGTMFQTGN